MYSNKNTTPTDLPALRTTIQELVYDEKYTISWNHIKSRHPNITEIEILNGLVYGSYKPDRDYDGRYIAWSRFTYPKRLIRIVFEIHETDDDNFILVITAFDEE